MKRSPPLLIALLLAAVACSSAGNGGEGAARSAASAGEDEMETTNDRKAGRRLTLVADLAYVLPIGYGHRWKASVREVREGTLADDTLQLSLLAHDYDGVLPCCEPRAGLLLEFEAVGERPGALEGFVAADGTVWKVHSVRADTGG